MAGSGVLLDDVQAAQFEFEGVASAAPPASRVVKTMPLSVRVEAGIPWWVTGFRKVVGTIWPVTGGGR